MANAPCYVVFAGVNGSGKSTFFHTGLWCVEGIEGDIPRVNPDEILVQHGLDSCLKSSQIKAGKIALEQIKLHFSKLESFNQETTLSGFSAIKHIKQAYDLGYCVYLFYIGAESAEVALSRIENRVSFGGHRIEERDVRRRAKTSLENFGIALDYCHYAAAFDNTDSFKCLALWKDGTLAWWSAANRHTPWLADAMRSEKWRA